MSNLETALSEKQDASSFGLVDQPQVSDANPPLARISLPKFHRDIPLPGHLND